MSVHVAVDPAPPRTVAHVTDELRFTASPPGMVGLHRFALSALDEAGLLFAMRSADDDAVRLFVVPPRPYFPAYSPPLDAGTLDELGTTPDDVVLLVVVHPGADGRPPTANLLAPIAVNPATGAARQVVLDGDEWPLRAPMGAEGTAA